MGELSFLRPGWLLLIPAGLWLVALATRHLDALGPWRRRCDPALLPHLLAGEGSGPGRGPALIAGACVVLAAVALAGPGWQRAQDHGFRSGSARVLVLDVSRSMDAEDVAPSRLHLARRKLEAALERPFDGQTGLVVFGGDAFVVSPLTDDAHTLLAMLPALDSRVVPVQGGRADRGLTMAARLLANAGVRHGQVLLVTDGVPREQSRREARALLEAGHPLSVLGVGTARGAPVPLEDGELLKDDRGRAVVARLDEAALALLARDGGGIYARLTADDDDLERIERAARETGDAGTRAVERRTRRWQDQGVWLLPPLLLLAALAFRRGWLLGLALVVSAPVPSPVRALDLDTAFRRADQRAARALARGDVGDALRAGAGPGWTGAAYYRSGDFEAAAREFEDLDSATGHYNRGNALARTGRLEPALKAYDVALTRDPTLSDARFNRELVRRALERRKPRRQQRASDRERARSQEGDTEGIRGFDDVDPLVSAASGTRATGAGRDADGTPGEAAGGAAGPVPGSPAESRESRPGPEEVARLERWLDHIPDDPGGLLRRKFALEYARRQRAAGSTGSAW